VINIKTTGDGFYIVEDDGDVTVLSLLDGEWYDCVSGSYASYDIKPTRIIEKILLPVKENNND